MAEASTSSPLAVLTAPGPLKEKPAQVKAALDQWLIAQPAWVDAASAGLFGSFQGAFLGTLMGSMTKMNLEQGGAPMGELSSGPASRTHVVSFRTLAAHAPGARCSPAAAPTVQARAPR
jgi:hypothetical protein